MRCENSGGVTREEMMMKLASMRRYVLAIPSVCRLFALMLFFTGAIATADPIGGHPTGLRGPTPLAKEPTAPLIPKVINDDVRKARAYPMQPPVIPHQIENYQIDKNYNKCMTCHGREKVAESQAPMVSVTHFMDRAGNFRAEISPRRYFCTQCHVSQTDVKVPVTNTFLDAASATTSAPSKSVTTSKRAKK
jgi:nitrate reductase (cytochrome), electron transfer subunit